MKRPTELMRQILTHETSKRIIDWVSPIYGDSYVGLWLYEAIGAVLDEVVAFANSLRYEMNPMTTEVLMDYWEDQYGLYRDSTLNMDKRRERLLDAIRSRYPCNPKRLAASLATVLGVPVEIEERVAKNTFLFHIQDSVADFKKLLHAIYVLEQRKPAHLIYWINVTSRVDETDLKLATAAAQDEMYRIGVEDIKLTLQTTLEKAINLGATVSIGEEYSVGADSITIDTTTDIESHVEMAAPISSAEQYSVEAVKRIARIAVDLAINLSSHVESAEEYNIEEVKTDE